jgi:hypothetical protein
MMNYRETKNYIHNHIMTYSDELNDHVVPFIVPGWKSIKGDGLLCHTEIIEAAMDMTNEHADLFNDHIIGLFESIKDNTDMNEEQLWNTLLFEFQDYAIDYLTNHLKKLQ